VPIDSPRWQVVADVDELRTLYRRPHPMVVAKERPTLDEATCEFIAAARFVAIGSFDTDGNADVSPRGGERGFIRVLDDLHIAIADLGGNNRLDSMQNIIATGRVGLLVVVPGTAEAVRINGAAWVSADPELLAGFTMPRRPVSAIVARVETTFIHYGKAFTRSGMWDPESWMPTTDAARLLMARGFDAPAAST
jgi:PPOX class probable FMN-dependent enzyme